MAAVPQNNLREQLRRHSARGALSAPPPPARDRPPGFTFKKAPRGLGAAAVLRDKDVNTSLALPASAPPPRGCVPPPSPGPQPVCAPAAAPGARPASAAPAAKAGPGSGSVITIGDEWDDIDDFDLSGIEKRFSRPPVVSPKGLRAPGREPPRPSPRPAGPGGGGEAAAEAEPRPCSQRSVICLEDSAPSGGSSAEGPGCGEQAAAEPPRDAGSAGARPGNGCVRAPGWKNSWVCSPGLLPRGLLRSHGELRARHWQAALVPFWVPAAWKQGSVLPVQE